MVTQEVFLLVIYTNFLFLHYGSFSLSQIRFKRISFFYRIAFQLRRFILDLVYMYPKMILLKIVLSEVEARHHDVTLLTTLDISSVFIYKNS